MGSHPNITYEKFPRQGTMLNEKVKVCFHHDTTKHYAGIVIRDDVEEPFRTIIQLDNGRVLLAEECQYALWEY